MYSDTLKKDMSQWNVVAKINWQLIKCHLFKVVLLVVVVVVVH